MNYDKTRKKNSNEVGEPAVAETPSSRDEGVTRRIGGTASAAANHSAEAGGTDVERQLFMLLVTAWQHMKPGTYRGLEIKDSDPHITGTRGREIKVDLDDHPSAEIGFVFWPEGGHRAFLADRPAIFQVVETAFDTEVEDPLLGDDQLPVTGRIYSFLDDGKIHVVEETHDKSMYENPGNEVDFEEGFYKIDKPTTPEDIAKLAEILTKIKDGEYEPLDPEKTYSPIDYWGLYEGEWEEDTA